MAFLVDVPSLVVGALVGIVLTLFIELAVFWVDEMQRREGESR